MARNIVAPVGLALLALALAACQAGRSERTLAEMNPAEVEAAVKELEDACRERGVNTGSRAYDECVKAEAVKRGYTR
jgi:hypothetical protein